MLEHWVVWSALAVGGATGHDGTAVIRSLGVHRPVASWLEVEGIAGAGALGGPEETHHADPERTRQGLFRAAGGVRLTNARSPGFRPFLFLGTTHFHQVPEAGLKDDFFGSVGGVSEHIVHRFGAEAALGAAWPMLLPRGFPGKGKLQSEARVAAIHLPAVEHGGARTYLLAELALGWRF